MREEHGRKLLFLRWVEEEEEEEEEGFRPRSSEGLGLAQGNRKPRDIPSTYLIETSGASAMLWVN